MKTIIKISTKKGHTQETTWHIIQAHPYPDIEKAGSWRWRNAGGMFDAYNQPATGLEEKYYCNLLRSDFSEVFDNRKDYAGYEGNPGSIVLRGQDLGEMNVTVNNSNRYNEIKVNGFDSPTSGVRAWIEEAIIPGLLKAIEEHKAELKAEAVEAVRQRIIENVKEARSEIDKLELEALEAVKKL
jgi:hypothetical protein